MWSRYERGKRMSKWIAEFDLEDGDTMPEHMDLNYMGAKIDFYCRPMWIPISERLPKQFETVILSTDKDEVFIGDYLGKMNDESDCFDDNDGMGWEGNVVAWMPLPQAYREVEE